MMMMMEATVDDLGWRTQDGNLGVFIRVLTTAGPGHEDHDKKQPSQQRIGPDPTAPQDSTATTTSAPPSPSNGLFSPFEKKG